MKKLYLIHLGDIGGRQGEWNKGSELTIEGSIYIKHWRAMEELNITHTKYKIIQKTAYNIYIYVYG